MELIENRTFDEIQIGDSAKLERTLSEQDITLFAVMSGDINPAHVDPEYAMSSRFREVIGHGMWSGALISTVLGTVFPGPGTIYLGQNLRFRRPVRVGDSIQRVRDRANGKPAGSRCCGHPARARGQDRRHYEGKHVDRGTHRSGHFHDEGLTH
jgi:acyl dehydratase